MTTPKASLPVLLLLMAVASGPIASSASDVPPTWKKLQVPKASSRLSLGGQEFYLTGMNVRHYFTLHLCRWNSWNYTKCIETVTGWLVHCQANMLKRWNATAADKHKCEANSCAVCPQLGASQGLCLDWSLRWGQRGSVALGRRLLGTVF